MAPISLRQTTMPESVATYMPVIEPVEHGKAELAKVQARARAWVAAASASIWPVARSTISRSLPHDRR